MSCSPPNPGVRPSPKQASRIDQVDRMRQVDQTRQAEQTGPANRPTAEQVLLLRAALLAPRAARPAWENWQAAVDFDNLDKASFQVLPLLYNGLQPLEVASPLLKRLKGIYRQTWYKNQLAVHDLCRAIHELRTAGLSVLVVGGSALALLYYRDWGTRPLGSCDLLVPRKQALKAARLLQYAGWTTHPRLEQSSLSHMAVAPFFGQANRIIKLHWHFLPIGPGEPHQPDYHRTALSVSLENLPVLTLKPELQLLHTLSRGIIWNEAPSTLWLADSFMMIRQLGPDLDWDYLVARAVELRTGLALRHGLECLRTLLDVDVPNQVFKVLIEYRPSRLEILEHRVNGSRSGLAELSGRLPGIMLAYARWRSPGMAVLNPVDFLRFIRWRWGHAHNLSLLKDILAKTGQRIAASTGIRRHR